MKIARYHFHNRRVDIKLGRDASIIPQKPSRDGFNWFDITNLNERGCVSVGQAFGLHPITIDDCISSFRLPKVETFPKYFFLVFHGFVRDREKIVEREVDFILTKDTLISFQFGTPERWWTDQAKWVEKRGELVAASGPDFLLHVLIEALVGTQEVIIDQLTERIERIEQTVLKERENHVAAAVLREKHLALQLRRSLAPQREMLVKFSRGDIPFISPQNRFHFRDVADFQYRLAERLDTSRDLLSNVLELSLAQVSNRMNEVMKVLTIISTIILPLTLVTGIYGMNFQVMPELNWKHGYPITLGIMAVIALGLIAFFKKRKWI
ncbi:MAG: magnesium/cobalt transporter CorA [bacterium]|nr:magnesium/cobalt transporter CorA [bacterium]